MFSRKIAVQTSGIFKSCIGLYAYRVFEPLCVAGSNTRYDRGALYCSKGLKIVIELTWRDLYSKS